MVKKLEKYLLHLHDEYGVTPNMLTWIRIFSAPWLALLVSYSISGKHITFAIFTLVFYATVVATDFLDGIMARALIKRDAGHAHDKNHGGMLDRLADKVLIIFMLVPFGLNLLTISIIGGESILAYEALNSPAHKKQATTAGKLKMLFQAFLIPILVLSKATNLVPDFFLYTFIIVTIILTYISIYSHVFKDDN